MYRKGKRALGRQLWEVQRGPQQWGQVQEGDGGEGVWGHSTEELYTLRIRWRGCFEFSEGFSKGTAQGQSRGKPRHPQPLILKITFYEIN